MNIHVETDRLILRDLEPTDAPDIFALDSNPNVHEFLGKKPIQTLAQAEAIIDLVCSQYQTHGIGRWAMIEKATNNFIGWTGLKYEQNIRPNLAYYDLGYRLREKYWGCGFATESAIASLRYGFEQLQLSTINAAADVQHVVSNHILQKVGLKQVDVFEYVGLPHYWYELTQVEWRAGFV